MLALLAALGVVPFVLAPLLALAVDSASVARRMSRRGVARGRPRTPD
jgi:hypothetical protein